MSRLASRAGGQPEAVPRQVPAPGRVQPGVDGRPRRGTRRRTPRRSRQRARTRPCRRTPRSPCLPREREREERGQPRRSSTKTGISRWARSAFLAKFGQVSSMVCHRASRSAPVGATRDHGRCRRPGTSRSRPVPCPGSRPSAAACPGPSWSRRPPSRARAAAQTSGVDRGSPVSRSGTVSISSGIPLSVSSEKRRPVTRWSSLSTRTIGTRELRQPRLAPEPDRQ